MYIITNGQTHSAIQVLSAGSALRLLGESLPAAGELDEPIEVYADNDFLLQTIDPAGYLRQELKEGSWLLTNEPLPPEPQAEPTVYSLLDSTAAMVKFIMQGKSPETDDEKIVVSALWDEWTAGSHEAGEIYSVDAEPWECYQSYDNATHPDIQPGGSTWQTFNRPLHGTSRETARYFVQPTGAHDIYKTGEWMVSSGRFWRCTENTAYSPEDYPQAWQDET